MRAKKSVDPNKSLLLSKGKSDVYLIIDDTELPAHRSILSKRSEYFKTMFSSSFVEANSDKITLKETNLNAFKFVLEYIYTGTFDHIQTAKLTIHEKFEVISCARYYMVDELPLKMVFHIKMNKYINFCLLLDNACVYNVDELILYCTNLIRKGKRLFGAWTFYKMSPPTVEYLLQLRLDTHESSVFEELVLWMRHNRKYSSLFPKLLKHVDLYLLEKKHLDMLFRPIQLIERSFFQNLVKEQWEKAKTVQKIDNQNVIGGIDDLRIVEGYKLWRYALDTKRIYASEHSCIIIDLKQQYLLNCIKLNIEFSGNYTVSVSKNMRYWKRVINHLKYIDCARRQVLHFKECAFRFIRIDKVSPILTNIEALYSTDPLEIDTETTLIVPNQNIVSTEIMYDLESETEGGYIDGRITDGYVKHDIDKKSCIVYAFLQPYMIGSLKLLLKEKSSYYVAVSANKKKWKRVFGEDDVIGWRIVTFEKQPVLFIKIVGTKAPLKCFKLYELKCPAN